MCFLHGLCSPQSKTSTRASLTDALHNIVNLGQSVTKGKKNLQNALLNPANTQSVLDNIHTRKLDQHS